METSAFPETLGRQPSRDLVSGKVTGNMTCGNQALVLLILEAEWKKPRSQRVDQRIVCQLDQRIVYADTRTCVSCTQEAAAPHGAQQSPQRQARASEQQSPQTQARAVVATGTTGDDDRARGSPGSKGPALRAEATGSCGKGKKTRAKF